MPAKYKWRGLVLSFLAVAYLLAFLSAETGDVREYHGKQVTCTHSGWFELANACGTRGYARIFTGTVRSVVDIGETQKGLLIAPDEVFLGDSKEEVAAITNQGCLRTEIHAGDKWLFFLLPYVKSDFLLLPHDSPSKPVAEAEDDISVLRNLALTTNSGILMGSVQLFGATYDVKPVPLENHKVVATDATTGTNYTTFTNSNGHFKFDLPEGFYNVSATTGHGYREIGTFPSIPEHIFRVPVSNHECSEHKISLIADGKLAGRITTFDGKSAKFVKVSIVQISPAGPTSTVVADENGYFEIQRRQPGEYLVGVGVSEPFASTEWKSRVYYPGVSTQEQAGIVKLGVGEWRTNIDFKLPPRSINP